MVANHGGKGMRASIIPFKTDTSEFYRCNFTEALFTELPTRPTAYFMNTACDYVMRVGDPFFGLFGVRKHQVRTSGVCLALERSGAQSTVSQTKMSA